MKSIQKKAPCHEVLLRVEDTAGARGNSPACGGGKQADALFPSVPPMLGLVTKGK